MMMKLSEEQGNAVYYEGNTYVTACPGSGKTRALTAKLSLGMSQLSSLSEKVLAVTYTNRAADEIKYRIEQDENYDSKKLWAGTIHSFALGWIIRPYAGYLEQLNNGYVVADEYETRKIISQLKQAKGMSYFDDVNTSYSRSGNVHNLSIKAREVEREYRGILTQRKKIDFDQALYFAYTILKSKPEIAKTLGAIFRLFCIDEVQDTQDLQYAILSKIHNNSLVKPNLFIVGDINQAIYENLGGVSKTLSELNQEFEHGNLVHFGFSDNYRSTQRLTDYFSYFRNTQGILSKADHADESGKIVFSNQEIDKQDLADVIANIVQDEINSGVAESEICIIAPQWSPIRSLTKKLINLLPNVKFDAPSLSPFYGQQDNFWLTVSKLALTIPSGRLFSTRVRWANEVIANLNESFHKMKDISAKKLLMIINSFNTDTLTGTVYLDECFKYLLSELEIELEIDINLAESHSLFFEKAAKNMEISQGEYENDIDVFRGFFSESAGVVVNSCHGVKGEEYETVIAFGMLKGFVPHWSDIIGKPDSVANNSESKMMYVIASRAKKNIYLIAERGRQTKTRRPYETSSLLKNYNYAYD
jgi:superfamily I DNA/RNA helicase